MIENDPTLRAVIARLFPDDGRLGGDGNAMGVPIYLARHFSIFADHAGMVADGLRTLDTGQQFLSLSTAEQDACLNRHDAEPWLTLLAELVAEAVYAEPGNGGNPDAVSWQAVGYHHGLPEGPSGPEQRDGSAPRAHSDRMHYDAIIVGAGAGGGVAAALLAEAGRSVLLIERGVERSYTDSGHRDHLRNHRLALYGHNTGPDLVGNPRVFVDQDGRERIVAPNEGAYQNLAANVGSGTFVYGAMVWRFHRDDFRMASLYGVPEGSSLVDWPFDYEELAPWYERVEQELGVAGDAARHSHEGSRTKPYPLPPLPTGPATDTLAAGAAKLGLRTTVPPLAVNSQPRDGRAACIGCGSCVGFPCPSNAKNGTQNTFIPRAMASGNCELLTGAMVHRLDTDVQGKVIGIQLTGHDGTPMSLRSDTVILAAGAIETARLLLNSPTAAEPHGIGNNSDHVGRHLQGHVYPQAYGLFDHEVHGSTGPGVTIGTTDFNHGNDGIVGGGLLADDFVQPPILFWKACLPPDLKRWGSAAHDFMRDNFGRVLKVTGPIHEIPSPLSRVSIAPEVRDRWHMPVARLSGTIHAETLRTAKYMQQRAFDWLDASGALRRWGPEPRLGLSGGQHQAGTCRMGTDPAHSVTDTGGRVWGHDNLYICDGAVHPTNGGFNPVLTIMAMSYRTAAGVVGKR